MSALSQKQTFAVHQPMSALGQKRPPASIGFAPLGENSNATRCWLRLKDVSVSWVLGPSTRANKPDGYLLGSYRIATAPEPNSSRLTSFKSKCFDSPANSVGPWPASLGCTTNSYSSINPSSANASRSFTPPTTSPLPDCCFRR